MFKKTSLFILTILLLAPCGFTKAKIQIAPEIIYMNGTTEYSFDVTYNYRDSLTMEQINETIESKLEFPLDHSLLKFSFQLTSNNKLWEINSHLAASIKNPNDKMIDSDWHGKMPYFERTMFSKTESDVSMKMYTASLDFSRRLFGNDKTKLSAMAGFKYQFIDQKILNFVGWFRPFDEINNLYGMAFNVSGDEEAILYKLDYYLPFMGVKIERKMTEKFFIKTEIAYSRAFYSDSDDHLLRNKRSTSTGDGSAFIVNSEFRLNLTSQTQGSDYFVAGTVSYLTLDASGSQIQVWYDDEGYTDPSTGEFIVEVPKGTTIIGIPHDVKSGQLRIGLKFGLTF